VALVPDGGLAYLPFDVLPEPGGRDTPLCAGHEVVVLPSASVLVALRDRSAHRPSPPRRLAVLADPLLRAPGAGPGTAPGAASGSAAGAPGAALARGVPPGGGAATRTLHDLGLRQLEPLPYSRQEAQAILALVPAADRLDATGAAASRQLVVGGQLAPFGILHFATHALVHPRMPELSGIALSMFDEHGRPQEGFLQSYEIADLRLSAELVVLSACRTGLGQELRGEGLVGLTQSFFHAGAARVVVSLWNVDDRATARLMAHFYGELLSGGRSPAAALRAAQLALRAEPRWAAPYYWAGFELQGDWRPLP
jgi:CHAT domain-containing protein